MTNSNTKEAAGKLHISHSVIKSKSQNIGVLGDLMSLKVTAFRVFFCKQQLGPGKTYKLSPKLECHMMKTDEIYHGREVLMFPEVHSVLPYKIIQQSWRVSLKVQ